ncbi:hypothetical protein IJE86_08445 [bacterium]|nr:hypothetical protein [bacterium]
MSISVTKNQENFNPLKWAAYGATAGYIAKDLVPVTNAEKEHYQFEQFITDRKTSVRSAVDKELAAVKDVIKKGTTDAGYDTYVKFIEPPKTAEERAKYLSEVVSKLPDEAKETFYKLKNQVDEKVRAVKKSHNFMYDAAIKKMRPVASYMLIGSMITTGAAFVTHVLSKMTPKYQD